MRLLLTFLALCIVGSSAYAQTPADSTAIMRTLENYERGWNEGDVALLVQDYADDVDWTNAFGVRVVGRDSLAARLNMILSLDIVRAGQTEQIYNDLTFLDADIALLRSKSVVRGQLHTDGEPMADRHNHHLRVFQRRLGQWVIVSHLISQANEHR